MTGSGGSGPTGVVLRRSALPAAVIRLSRLLEDAPGGAAYVVGGAVRDLFLGRPTRDYDLATPLVPDTVGGLLATNGYRAVPTGLRFGTWTAIDPDGTAIEVTTLRAEEGYRDHRHPDRVAWTDDVARDLARRDFTVNAMAWRPFDPAGGADGSLADPFGGRADLAKRRLRAVGVPEERLREDPLRIARLFRFAAELDMRPDRQTLEAARALAPELAHVARERVRDELERLLMADHLWSVAEPVAHVLLPAAIPAWRELTAFEETRWKGTFSAAALWSKRLRAVHKPVDMHSVLAVTRCPPRPVLRWAALVHDLAKPRTFALTDLGKVTFHDHEKAGAAMAREALTDLRLPTRTVERVADLVAVHLFPWQEASPAGVRRLIRRLGPDGARDLLELHRADVEASTPLGWPDYPVARDALEAMLADQGQSGGGLAVGGADVMRVLAIGPGPKVGEILAALTERILDDPAQNTRPRLLARLAERRWLARD